MKTMTNGEIYSIANAMQKAFEDSTQRLPVKVNFYMQKNKATLIALAQEVEKSRVEILQKYGTLNEETNQFEFKNEDAQTVVAELNELFSIEQEVNIYTVDIDSFGEAITLTTEQMEALMFMID
jgi:tRNA G26 N,N-dimethylase Trm1